jgi:hypothetical protein
LASGFCRENVLVVDKFVMLRQTRRWNQRAWAAITRVRKPRINEYFLLAIRMFVS